MMNAKPKSSQPEGPAIVATAKCSISTCGAGVRKFKRMSVSKLRLPFLTPAKRHTMSTDCALSLKGLWRDLINARELKAGQADGNFACSF